MEYFYRDMRKRYGVLLDGAEPCGGKWNYDAENRAGWRNLVPIPDRPDVPLDEITQQVIQEVSERFPNNPGDLSRFRLAVTHADAQFQFDWFCEHALGNFGTYQDALPESPGYSTTISMYLNCGLLEPLEVCQRVEAEYRADRCPGGRGLYSTDSWLAGISRASGCLPEYATRNTFDTRRPCRIFWTGDTDLRCLQRALQQSLDLGYAHHIQRLMVIGNFALAGLDVDSVCAYLAVYVDAYEWVELPNTAGMALYADDGAMASKPYAASGKYIQKQGNHQTVPVQPGQNHRGRCLSLQ